MYLVLFCKYESFSKGIGMKVNKGMLGIRDEEIVCKVYGLGLRVSELGKVVEFIVELNGVKLIDIIIVIECKLFWGVIYEEKFDLSVKLLSRNIYCVKYLFIRFGDYVISILYCGVYILRSFFYLIVLEYNDVKFLKMFLESY